MKLVIRDNFICGSDNEFIPTSIFRGGDEKIFVHIFKHCIIINDIFGRMLPIFEQFGGVESSYIGSQSVKIKLDRDDVIFI
jgi:hypothetical protein